MTTFLGSEGGGGGLIDQGNLNQVYNLLIFIIYIFSAIAWNTNSTHDALRRDRIV